MLEGELKVIPVAPLSESDPSLIYLQNAIEIKLKTLFQDYKKKNFLSALPVFTIIKSEEHPLNLTFIAVSKYRMGAFSFLFNLITEWFLPGKRLDVAYHYAVDFRLLEISNDVLTYSEFNIYLESPSDLEMLLNHYSIISNDALLGISSETYAKKIMEVRGTLQGQKIVILQQQLSTLIRRLPEFFTSDLLTEMQHFLVLCYNDFKEQRSVSHLARLIVSHYLFRKNLLKSIKSDPQKRVATVKLFRTTVNFPQGTKNIVALNLGLNFLHEKEVVEQRHIIRAIKKIIPTAAVIDQTFFQNRKGGEPMASYYVEIEKAEGKPFTLDEIKKLRKELPVELENHIAKLTLPVFMPRNEEEIMRNILSLAHQLKYIRDLPQVFISFDEQTEKNLFFTVIFVRILKEGEKPLLDKLKEADSFLKTHFDRIKMVGLVRKKYPKEATVFRVKFAKENFIRGDHSIDLYKARQAVVNELTRAIGEFRDFNGGMISKQNELLSHVKEMMATRQEQFNEVLLEKFFFSLSPVIMRTVLEPFAFESLFLMLLQELKAGAPPKHKLRVNYKVDPDFTYVILSSLQRGVLDEAHRALHKFQSTGADLIQGYLKTSSGVYMGYIFRCLDVHKQIQFKTAIENLVLDSFKVDKPVFNVDRNESDSHLIANV